MRKVRHPVASVDEVLPDIGKRVMFGTEPGECVLYHHHGNWYAVGSLCPHQNAPLEGTEARDGRITCKRHGYCFDLKTGDCTTLGGYGIPVYDVQIEAGTVYISVWEFD